MRLGDLDVLAYKAKNEVLFLGRHSGKTQAQLEFIVNTLIEHTPTIDAVPVIRCKKCRFWDEDKKGFSDECLCKRWSTEGVADYFTEPESFCRYADPKE